MDTPFYREPVPALVIAVGIGILASKANSNAAKALGVSPIVFGGLLALLFGVLGLGR